MADVRASAEVEALIGAEALGRLSSPAFASFNCSQCGRPGITAQPSAVVVYLDPGQFQARVTLAHAACGPSRIITAPIAPALSALSGMRAGGTVLDYPDPPRRRALLMMESRAELITVSAGGEITSPWVAALLSQGMTLMTGAADVPPPAPGWRLRCRRGTARTAPGRDLIYDGPFVPPRGWLETAAAAGGAVTLVGSIGLYATPGAPMTATRLNGMLSQAAAAGMLAGALITPRAGSRPGYRRGRGARSYRAVRASHVTAPTPSAGTAGSPGAAT